MIVSRGCKRRTEDGDQTPEDGEQRLKEDKKW